MARHSAYKRKKKGNSDLMYKGDKSLKLMQLGGEVETGVDTTLSMLSSFLPTGGKITQGGMVLGENVEDLFGNKETYGANMLGRGVKYGAAGAELGNAIVPGVGGLVGGAIGATTGLVAGVFGKKKLDEQLAEQEHQNDLDMVTQAQSGYNMLKSSGFSEKGNAYAAFRKLGGFINGEYEVEKGEVIHGEGVQLEGNGHKKLADGITLVGGQKHSQGGVEGKGGDRVYSDHLKIGEELKETLNMLGIDANDNDTYADVAEKVGKKKGQIEKKGRRFGRNGLPGIEINTKNMMFERYDQAEDMLFQAQEIENDMNRDLSTIRQGGRRLRTYLKGGKLKYRNGGGDEGEELTGLIMPEDDPYAIGSSQYGYKQTGLYKEPLTEGLSEADPQDPLKRVSRLEQYSQDINDFFSNNKGDAIYKGLNTAQFLLNRNDVSKFKTDPKLGSTPPSMLKYRDRSGYARNRVERLARDTVNTIDSSSARVKASAAANILAKASDSLSDINNKENARRDQIENANVGITNDFKRFKDATDNQNKLFKIASENDKLSRTTDVRTAYLDSLSQQRAFDEASRINKKAIILQSLRQNDTKVLEHAIKSLGLNSIEELMTWLDS